MDAIQIARQLGKVIQEDDRFLNLRLAQQKNEEDAPLQAQIRDFNNQRDALNVEMKNPDRESAKIEKMNEELRVLYAEIVKNENMKRYVSARGEMNKLVAFINQIITGSVEGENPDLIEHQENCGSSCNSCSGCS